MKKLLNLVAGAVAAFAAYWFVVRPWHVHWGATDDEARRPLPGDDLVPQPTMQSTRAITIHAPAGQTWPWLVQMGQGRGGLYSYETLENLAGCDIHNVDRIVPELQNLCVGDAIRLGPEGYPLFVVEAIEPDRALVLLAADPKTGAPVRFADPMSAPYTVANWVFVLNPIDEATTRLVVRARNAHSPSLANVLLWRTTEALNFVMEQKMLRGIKVRAESAAHTPDAPP